MLCLEFIVVTATVDVVQCYCFAFEVIVVTTAVGIVQWFCVVCGVFCGDSYRRYCAMLL